MRWLRPLARIWTGFLGGTALTLALAVAVRLIVPLTPWAPTPTLVAASPPDGASDVHPRSLITLRFSAPMNRASARAAVRIEPATPGSLSWSADATVLTFTPATGLAPGSSYTIHLEPTALGRWWRPLDSPAVLRFRTAPQPAVEAAYPNASGTPFDTPIAVIFSQAMVAPEQVGREVRLPELRVEPAIAVRASWADQRTLLLRPDAPLAPATTYQVTIGAALADLRGVELGTPFSWSFTTTWPELLDRTPTPGARWVSPREPLTLRLAAPLEPTLLQQALRITPEVEGELRATRVGATQVITFTPRAGWAYGTTYTVALVEPPGSTLGAAPVPAWSFAVEPRPRLVAFFPGQGQLLRQGQPVRLVFSTPMEEEAVRGGLSIEPPVDEVPISVDETEVRLSPALRPSTVYTITISAGTRDRAGEPLAADAVVRLRTPPANPSLVAPDVYNGLVTLPVSRSATLALEVVNLSALDLSLYQLDQPTLLRALALRPDELPDFSPERYGQPLARRWRATLSEPADRLAQLTLPVGLADGDPLAPGAYYLRALSPEGPRADLLLIVAAERLTLHQGPAQALIWATSAATGEPVANLPLALYQGETLVARGATNPDGVWAQPISTGVSGPLLAIAEGSSSALVRGDWAAPAPPEPPRYASVLAPDRAEYQAGDRVAVSGLVRRRAPDGSLGPPQAGDLCRLQLRTLSGVALTSNAPCTLDPVGGAVGGSLTLPARIEPGDYSLAVQIGDESSTIAIRVAPSTRARSSLDVAVAPLAPNGLQLLIARSGLPLVETPISWTLRLDPVAPPELPAGYTFGPLERDAPQLRSGQGRTDGSGRLLIDAPTPVGSTTWRYSLRVSTTSGDGEAETSERNGLFTPEVPLVAIGLPSRVLASDQRSNVNLIALDGLGRPVPGARIRLELYPAGGDGSAPRLVRQATADDTGRATTMLVQISPGEYVVVASADGGPPTRASLWVVGPRFTGWRAPPGQLTLVTDRDSYSPGDVATLLLAAPVSEASLLLTVERGDVLRSEVRRLRAGEPITVPITAAMAPGVRLSAVVTAPGVWRAGSTSITVADTAAPLTLDLATDSAIYLPASSATVTITTTAGALPVAADLLVTIDPDPGLPPDEAVAHIVPGPPALSSVATLPPPRGEDNEPLTLPRQNTLGTAVDLGAGAGGPGTVVARVPLPETAGRWRISAVAASGAGPPAVASVVVTTSLPLAYDLVSPPVIRAGDRATIEVLLRNTGPVTRSVQVALSSNELSIGGAAPDARRLNLAPGESTRLRWEVAAAAGPDQATVRLVVETPGMRRTLSRSIQVARAEPTAYTSGSFVASGPLVATVELPASASGPLELAVAPGVRAALADQAERIAARTDRGVEEHAALGLIAAGLARSAEGQEREYWAGLAREALAALDQAQNVDGGWGWWAGTPSQLFPTAFALEAQTFARSAIGDSRPPGLRSIAFLERSAPAGDADLRAYVAYVLSRAGRASERATLPHADELAADGLAFLALTLPTAEARPALDRLVALAVSGASVGNIRSTGWLVDQAGGVPRSRTIVTAAAAQALAARRPNAPALQGARAALRAAWGVDGWASSYEAARVAAAILPARADQEPGGPRRVQLGDATLIDSGEPITTTRRTTLAAMTPGERLPLNVQADGTATYMVAYRVAAPPPDTTGTLAIVQELVDPETGTPIDAGGIRRGQLVALRLTAVVARPLVLADLAVSLPAGLEPLATGSRGPFAPVSTPDSGSRRLTLSAANLEPGAYTQTIVARAVAAGSFQAPPARLADHHAPTLTAVASADLAIVIRE